MNIRDLRAEACAALDEAAFAYLEGGSDDGRTQAANEAEFAALGIRCRRLVDVSNVDAAVTVLGQRLAHPIALAPVGFQRLFHPNAECASARGAAAADALMVASTASSEPVEAVAKARGAPVWFQLYPTTDRGVTRALLARADAAGAPTIVLTVDVPVFGNREHHDALLANMAADPAVMGNLADLPPGASLADPGLTWDFVDWLREHCAMKIALKGIVTAEDAALAAERGVDAVVVSNHGGRQEESLRASLRCLPEVVDAAGACEVLFDGGVRRGTDAFKAMALGARCVFVGRPFVYGLAARGAAGVALAIDTLREELVRAMQLAGAPSLDRLDASLVERL